MKYTFTLLKIVRTLLLALFCLFGAEQAMAQTYTATLVESDATQNTGYYSAIAKDNSGNLYVVKYNGSSYQLFKWAGGNPASSTPLTLLASAPGEAPWGIAVNSSNNDVFVISANTGVNYQILRLTGGTGTATAVQTGKRYSAICLDNSNNLLAVERSGGVGSNYQVTRYAADGSGSGTVLYSGITDPNDGTFPWGIDTDSDGNIYVTNFYAGGAAGIIKLTSPTFTRAVPDLAANRYFTGLTIDGSNTLFGVELNSGTTYKVTKFTNASGTGTQIYNGLVSDGFGTYPWGIVEVGGNLYANDGSATTNVNGTVCGGQVIKLTPPNINVTSINRVTTTPSNANSVQFTVTFDGSATGVSTSNFTPTVTAGSISGASVASVTGSGSTYTVTVNTGTGNGTLRLDMANKTGITPNVATTMPFQSGQTILIDKTAPTGTIAISNGAAYATATAVTLNLTGIESGGSGGMQMEFSNNSGGPFSGYVAFATTTSFNLTPTDGTRTVYMHLRDAAGNVATFQDDIILDRVVPETGITSGPNDPTNSTSATFDFFSDDPAATFELQLDGGGYTATTDPVTLTSLAAGSHTINVRAVDAAGNKDLSPESYTWFIDLATPVVSSVTPPANGTYTATQQLNFTVTYNEVVNVTGTPTFPITIGGTVVNATYVSGTGTANLVFRYTVQTGDFDNNGIAVGSPIVLNGGTITDIAGNNANLTLNSIGNTTAVLVDATGPVVTSVTVPGNGTYIIAGQLNFTVNFDENVTVTGTPSFPVTIGSNTVQATYVSGTGSNALLFRYTVQGGDSDNDGIAVGSAIALNGGTLRDALANNATLTLNSIGNTTAVFVNTKQPVPTITTAATFPVTGAFTITVTFDEPVTGTLVAGEFTSINATLSGVTPVNSTTWTATITPPAGQQNGSGSVRVDANAVTNVPGNPSLMSNTLNISWDTRVPVISVTPPANQYYKAGDVISFTISYDEDVVVTGAPTLPLTINGTTRQATYAAGGDARTLIFSYTVAAGEQDLDGIDLAANIALNGGSIKDAAGNNAATGIATTNYPNILVDGRAPTVTSVAMPGAGPTPSGYYNAGTTLVFKVNTSETVTVSGTPTFDVIIGSTTRQAVFTTNTGNQLTFIYNIVDGDNDADGITIGSQINFPGGSSIRDAATNNLVATLNGIGDGSGIRINTNHPTVTITPPQAATVVAPFLITITFSEQTTDALALADFNLTGCTISSLSTTDNISWTGLITPTANAQGAGTIDLPADVVHNIATNGNQASAVYNFNYDTKTPAISSIDPPSNGTYKSGQVLTYTINYDDDIAVTGAPTLPIIIGSNTRNATLTGSTTTSLTFSYTTVNGDEDLDGIALGNIALNGGAIKDAVGHDAALTTANSYPGILVDAIAPVVTTVDVPINGYYKAGDVLDFRVHTSENITVTGAPTLDVNIGGVLKQAALLSGAGTNILVFSYTVVTGDNDGDGIALGALNLNGGTLQDPVGNNMNLALNGVPSTAGIFVNTVTPTVTLSNQTVVNAPWDMTVTFSEPVTGLTILDFTTTNANLTALTPVSSSVYTVHVAPPGDGPVSITLPAGSAVNVGDNGNAASNTVSYIYDGTAPTVTSVAVPPNGTYTNSDVINFVAYFDENVTVTGTPSIPVTIGAATVQATYTGGSGTNALAFSYTVQNGDYDIDGITVGAAIALNGGTIKDAATNNAVLTLNSIGNTTAVLVDAVPPAITSVNVPGNGYYKAGDVLNFTVDFNENVTVTGTPSVPVIIGSTTVQANYTGGTGTATLSFSYTVVAGDNDMDGIAVGSTLALNGGTVKDGLGNDAALDLNSVGNTDNVFVNTVIPTVTLSGTPVLNGPWTMTITFSEVVTGFIGTDITTTNANVSAPFTSDNKIYTVTVTSSANGPVSLNVPANSAFNIGGNGNSASNPINYTYDGTAPAVTSVNVPSAGGYNAGDVLSFTANFDENVVVTGTPSIPVIIGGTTVHANYVSGTGTNALIFSYTVVTGDNDADGIALGAAIVLNGGTIKDAATNNAVLTLNSVGTTSGVIVDAVAPVVTSVTVPGNGYYKGGQQLNFTVHFSENVTPSAVPSIPVIIGSTTVDADYVSGSGTKDLLFTYTVQPGDMDMDGIAVGSTIALNFGTIKDGVGNDAVLALNNIGNTSSVFVNTNSPTVVLSGTPVLNGSWTMTITFSEVVTGFALTDITATNATLSILNQTNSTTYTVLVTAGGDGTVTLNVPANIADNIAGNGNAASNTITYVHDGTSPAITSVNVPANGTYKAGDVLSFTANFNENVTVTGTPSLPLIIGSTNVQATYTGGSGTSALAFSYTVQNNESDLDGIALGAALQLNGGTIKDAATNNAVLTINGAGNTSAVLVDALAPVISSVTVPANGYYKAGDALNFTVQFSEAIVSAGSTATLPVTIGATTVQATIFSTPTPNTIVFRYVVQTGEEDLDGITVGAALVPGGTAIRDAAGNNASLTLNNVGNTSNVFILANRPTVTITGAISLTQPWTATITFSHAVTGFALTDITLTNAVASNLQTNDNITYTALISPVIQGGVSIEVLPNIAQDAAGNQNLPSSRLSYYYDPNPPVITSVEVPANGYYKQGDVLNFAVNWNEVVRNNVSPSKLTLPVTIGSTTVQAAYTGGYTTQRITFAYTVQAGQMDLDGIQLGTALQLPAGAEHITDLTGNNANLTLNSVPATTGVFVHTARPSVTLSSAAAARVNAPFSVTITFNELVTGLALTDFTLTNATVSNLQTTDNITYTVLVTPTVDGAASISLPADAAVNVVSNGNTASNTITRTYDATPPAIAAGQLFTVSQYSAAGTIVGTVTATDASGTVQNWALATDGSGGALQISTAGVITVKNTTLLNALVGTDVSLGVTVSDGLNTSTAVPVTVRVVFVNQPPTLDVISNVAICKDVQTHTIQLTGASATEPAQTYTITATSTSNIFDVLTVGAGNVLSYRLKADAPAGTATVAVTIRDNGGTTGGAVDSLRRTFTITVNALPVITITSDKGASISKGDIVKLTATGGSTYVWTAADGIISGQRTPVLEVKPMANASYEVTAASAAGCTAVGSFALSVVVDFKVDAVNILTPNGDGRNDRWVIRNLDSYPDNEVKIYDRAGRLIYSRRNYSNDWDGTVNGSPLAEGTYYYILTIQNGAKTATGYITIVRDRY